MFAINAVLQVVSSGAEWIEAYGFATRAPVEEVWPAIAAKVVIVPVVFTVLAMLVLLFTRLRPAVRACFRDPSTIGIGVVFGVSLALYAFTDLEVLSFVLGWLACVLASITQLRLEDLGPQPGLGAGFIVFSYVSSLFFPISVIAEDAEGGFTLPTSAVGWAGAVLGLVLAVVLLVRHVRREHAPAG